MSYNIYPIFFYVDPPSGGGGGADPSITPPSVSEDIGNGGYEETNGGGNGTITDNGNDITTEIGIMNEFRQSQGYSKDAKMIKSFSINNFSTVRNFLDPNGDRRNIIINGDVGAVFTLTIKDSSGCSMLDEDLEWISIPKTGTYIHTQHFPSIVKSADGGIMEEYYDVDLVKAADVIGPFKTNYRLFQYPNPTISFTTTSSATSPSLTVAVSNTSSITDKADTGGARLTNKEITLTLTITEDSATDGNFYIKSTDFLGSISSDSVIKKVVTREVGESPTSKVLNLKPLTTRTRCGITTGDLTAGMSIRGKTEETKTVTKSLEVPTCRKKTDKFELNDTIGLYEGLGLFVDNNLIASVTSIDCDRNITVSKKVIIRQNREVVFKRNVAANIRNVESNVNGDGNACIMLDREIYIPDGMELEFDDNNSVVTGEIAYSNSGTDSIVLTNTIKVLQYGTRDVTYTLDLDKIITRKPNAKNLEFETGKNNDLGIYLYNGDSDATRLRKVPIIKNTANIAGTVTVTSSATSGFLGPGLRYSPAPNFIGEEVIKYVLRDEDSDDVSEEKTINITVSGSRTKNVTPVTSLSA